MVAAAPNTEEEGRDERNNYHLEDDNKRELATMSSLQFNPSPASMKAALIDLDRDEEKTPGKINFRSRTFELVSACALKHCIENSTSSTHTHEHISGSSPTFAEMRISPRTAVFIEDSLGTEKNLQEAITMRSRRAEGREIIIVLR